MTHSSSGSPYICNINILVQKKKKNIPLTLDDIFFGVNICFQYEIHFIIPLLIGYLIKVFNENLRKSCNYRDSIRCISFHKLGSRVDYNILLTLFPSRDAIEVDAFIKTKRKHRGGNNYSGSV